MAQVPYNPTPDVATREAPVGPVNVRVDASTFGGAVGAAYQQAGGVLEHSGDEIFARAMAMQELHNQTVARDAQAQYMDKQGQLDAQFLSQRGAAAGPDALVNYQKQSNDLRSQFSDGIDSPAAKQIFDNDSMANLGRSLNYGARHSANELKNYALGTAQATIDNNASAALARPDDQLQYDASIADAHKAAAQRSAVQGYPPGSPMALEEDRKAVSSVVSGRIAGYARTNPLYAKSLLARARDDGSLYGQDIPRIDNLVNSQVMTGGSKMAVDGWTDGSSMLAGKGLVDINRAAQAIKDIESSGGNYSVVNKDSGALGAYQVMPSNLPQWLRDSGLPSMTPQQFLADHAAQDQVFKTKFGALMKQYGNANDAASAWLTGKPMSQAGGRADANGSTAPSYVTAFNKSLAKTATSDQAVSTLQTHMQELAPDVPLAQDAVKERFLQQEREQQAQLNFARRQTQQTIDKALGDAQGHTIGSIEQLKAVSPEVAQAVQNSDPVKVMALIRKAQAQDSVLTPERIATRRELQGMAENNPETFLDKSLFNADLTKEDRASLLKTRDKLLQGAVTEPHLHIALGIMQQDMDAAGIKASSDRDDYNRFTGALAEQLHEFRDANNRQPNRDEIKKIGAGLITQQYVAGSGWFGSSYGESKQAPYQMTPPDNVLNRMKSMPEYKGFTDDMLRQAYVGAMYKKSLGKTDAGH